MTFEEAWYKYLPDYDKLFYDKVKEKYSSLSVARTFLNTGHYVIKTGIPRCNYEKAIEDMPIGSRLFFDKNDNVIFVRNGYYYDNILDLVIRNDGVAMIAGIPSPKIRINKLR